MEKKLLDVWLMADYRIINLETPITDSKDKIEKNGPTLSADLDTINGIRKLNPNLLCLANNHIMDYGSEGFMDTISILDKENIPYIGVGDSLDNLIKSTIISKNELNIG